MRCAPLPTLCRLGRQRRQVDPAGALLQRDQRWIACRQQVGLSGVLHHSSHLVCTGLVGQDNWHKFQMVEGSFVGKILAWIISRKICYPAYVHSEVWMQKRSSMIFGCFWDPILKTETSAAFFKLVPTAVRTVRTQVGASSFKDAMRIGSECYHTLKAGKNTKTTGG